MRFAARVSVLLAFAWLSACAVGPPAVVLDRELSFAPRPPKPAGSPTVHTLNLTYAGGKMTLHGATPKRDNTTPFDPRAENRVLGGRAEVFEFELRNAAGVSVGKGLFELATHLRTEFERGAPARLTRKADTVLGTMGSVIKVPFDRATTRIEFRRLVPDPPRPINQWARDPVGSATLRP